MEFKSIQNGSQAHVLNHLIHALKYNKSSKIRKNAALILGKLGDNNAVNVLIQALGDRVASVRSNAAIALGMLGDKRAVKPLMNRLHSSSWQERLNAAISLGWLADPHAAPPLLGLLYDSHAYVRRGAAFALGQIATPETIQHLFKLLTHKQKPAYEAAVVLSYLGDLSGYFYLLNLPPFHFKEDTLEGKSKKTLALEGLKRGNLFYAAGLFQEAASEYRRTLGSIKRISSKIHQALLNNLGNALSAMGEVESATVLYHLALRLKPIDHNIVFNLQRSEILADIQDIVLGELLAWLTSEEGKKLQLPAGAFQFFYTLCKGIDKRRIRPCLRYFSLGWKSFYAFEAYQGEELFSVQTHVPPEFLESNLLKCQKILLQNFSLHHILAILFKVTQEIFPSEKENNLFYNKMFVLGYLSALLQKIWHLSHLKFSLN